MGRPQRAERVGSDTTTVVVLARTALVSQGLTRRGLAAPPRHARMRWVHVSVPKLVELTSSESLGPWSSFCLTVPDHAPKGTQAVLYREWLRLKGNAPA